MSMAHPVCTTVTASVQRMADFGQSNRHRSDRASGIRCLDDLRTGDTTAC